MGYAVIWPPCVISRFTPMVIASGISLYSFYSHYIWAVYRNCVQNYHPGITFWVCVSCYIVCHWRYLDTYRNIARKHATPGCYLTYALVARCGKPGDGKGLYNKSAPGLERFCRYFIWFVAIIFLQAQLFVAQLVFLLAWRCTACTGLGSLHFETGHLCSAPFAGSVPL